MQITEEVQKELDKQASAWGVSRDDKTKTSVLVSDSQLNQHKSRLRAQCSENRDTELESDEID